MKILFLFSVFVLYSVIGIAQSTQAIVSGVVKSRSGEPLYGAYLYVKENLKSVTVSEKGQYAIALKAGSYELVVHAMGYELQTKKVHLEPGDKTSLNFVLTPSKAMTLENVYLEGETQLTRVKKSSFTVSTIDAVKLHNTTLNLSQALERSSGINVRRSGGLGSDYSVMLNGFTGQHVKIFINGVPMEGFSSAFQLNNIPVDIAKRIEVYKGVVPISLGSDALGGAINIVTMGSQKSYVNASYSYGSFNTHKTAVDAAYTTDNGVVFHLTAYQNYSDNNYKVDADIVDLETMQFTDDIREVRRFHDRYRNFMVMGKIGLVNKSFADQLMLGFSYGEEDDQIQNPAYMKIAFGQKRTTSKTLMPSLTYRKRDLLTDNLEVSLTANYNFGKAKSIDDSYRRYNWLGDYIVTEAPGEFNYSRRFLSNQNGTVNANVNYTVAEVHHVTINNVLNTFSRKSYDEVEPRPTDDYPQKTVKNILGLAYKYQPNDRLSATLFGKHYYNRVSQYAEPDVDGRLDKMIKKNTIWGYGMAASYFLLEDLQLKASYEKAYRLPTARELFGAGNDFILGNPDLKPESSDNFNLSLRYDWRITETHELSLEGGFVYRDIKDFIHRIPNPSNGVLRPGNEAKVKNRGVDFSLEYRYADLLSIGGNLTYQNLRNKLKYKSGKDVVSTIYNDRIPNRPYLYGGAHAAVSLKELWQPEDALQITYNLNYIHEFDYSYESYGGREIPSQLSHNLALNYSLKDGKYTISLACHNLLDADLYDRYSLQLPGRRFSVKLRYFIDNF